MKSLAELTAAGGFVSAKPVERTITFMLDSDEKLTATVHVRRMSISDQERFFVAVNEAPEDRTARMLSFLVTFGEDGTEALPFDVARTLHPNLAAALSKAVNEVNGVAEKNSPPPSASSTT